ncbi:phage major capsid protein [Edwardsiella tarda]|uniref:phage major capsid family protein n=1 Tax=Edwardsiella tarda TaxID=636 RepID=UPI00351C77A1
MKMKMIREIQTQQTNDTNDDLIRVAFASELPVQREIQDQLYNEILLCTPENCDISYLQTTGAVLFNHDQDQLIGKIENVHIDSDHVCRAELKLSESTDKKQLFDEGILRNISVGYQILEYEIQGDDLLATKWQPYEISFVSCPADPTVGVNRGLDTEQDSESESTEPEQDSNTENEIASTEPENQVTEPESTEPEQDSNTENEIASTEPENQVTEPESTEPEQDSEPKNQVTEPENTEPEQDSEPENQVTEPDEREKELRAIGQLYQIDPETIENAIRNLISVSDFKKNINKRNENKPIENKDIKMEKNIFAKMLDAYRSTETNHIENAVRGMNGYKLSRAATTTTTAAGLVVENVTDGYIDKILAGSLFEQLNIQSVTSISGSTGGVVSIPKISLSESNFKFYDEGVAVADTPISAAKLTLTPHRFAGSIPVTKEMLKSGNATQTILEDVLVKHCRSGLEQQLLTKAMSGLTPINSAAVGTVTEQDILGMLETLGDANVDMNNSTAVISPAMLTRLRQVPVLKNSVAKALVSMDVNGNMYLMDSVKVIVSTLMPKDMILIGDFSYVVNGQWDSEELDLDLATGAAAAVVYVRYCNFIDIAITNPEAFAALKVKVA